MIGCNVYGHSYECAGAPTRFYLATLIMAMSLLGLTILIDVANPEKSGGGKGRHLLRAVITNTKTNDRKI